MFIPSTLLLKQGNDVAFSCKLTFDSGSMTFSTVWGKPKTKLKRLQPESFPEVSLFTDLQKQND